MHKPLSEAEMQYLIGRFGGYANAFKQLLPASPRRHAWSGRVGARLGLKTRRPNAPNLPNQDKASTERQKMMVDFGDI